MCGFICFAEIESIDKTCCYHFVEIHQKIKTLHFELSSLFYTPPHYSSFSYNISSWLKLMPLTNPQRSHWKPGQY